MNQTKKFSNKIQFFCQSKIPQNMLAYLSENLRVIQHLPHFRIPVHYFLQDLD